MKAVIDSNILFTLFWKDAVATQLWISNNLELYAPEFAWEEIDKYSFETTEQCERCVQ